MASKSNGKSRPVHKPPAKSPKPQTSETPPQAEKAVTIVGIAGSAGALNALQTFFDALPGETGLAFVVVTHLHPEHESHMAELLQGHTKMNVSQVNRKTALQPDHVYVIPPSRNLLITDSHVDVAEFKEPRGKRTPIDFFFRSLAYAHRDAVAIILSGSGTDGAVGVKAIKEQGGLIMVQDPQEAEYDSMPGAAIGTGLVDVISPMAELAIKLMRYVQHTPRVPLDADGMGEEDWDVVRRILMQVQQYTGHDFSQYKRTTVLRRIRRRTQLLSLQSLSEYLQYLQRHREEASALLNDLLIGVTNFFRDHAAWDALAQDVIPSIFKRKDPSERIRVWSIGCSTGEEAYSLAILLLEHTSILRDRFEFQIFASDLDEAALIHAREGLYPSAIEADISPERLLRFFVRREDHYQVRRELRDMILFTNHSVLRDPPFSRQDLISCRNLLIYMQLEIQQNVMDTLHYALNPAGYLFLGNSESAETMNGLFQPIDKTHHIYQAKPWQPEHPHVPSLPLSMRPPSYVEQLIPPRSEPRSFPKDALLLGDQHRKALESFAPPSILVNGEYAILHISESAGRYLFQPRGPITTDLLKLARPELQPQLRAALFQAFEQGKATVSLPVDLDIEGRAAHVVVSANPRRMDNPPGHARDRQALVVFLEDETGELASRAPGQPSADSRELAHSNAQIAQLETEVERLREQLQTTTEEYDSSNEEMKAANEELQSINEEYHLTTEELETSKEELEAVNEELITVNNELKLKLEELSRSHRDMENVMRATEIAALYLDRSLQIQWYTPALLEFFDILPTDVGRPIGHLHNKLGYDRFVADARSVLDSPSTVDRELHRENGDWFLMRLRPYHNVADKIEGVVVSFIDITVVKHAEILEELVEERTGALGELSRKYQQMGDMFSMLFHVNPIPTSLTRLEDGLFLDINDAYLDYFGLSRETILGHTSGELHLPFEISKRDNLVSRLRTTGGIRNLETEIKHPNGQNSTVLASLQSLRVDGADAILSTFIDITHRVQAERQIRALASNLTAAEQKERHRISQVLHDDLQQRLFAVKMQLTFLQDAYQRQDTEGIQKDSTNIQDWLNEAIDTTRRLSIDLSPIILQGENLADAVSWLNAQMRERYGLEVALRANGPVPRLDDDTRVMLFHTIRELLFNVVKHADIGQAAVTLEQIGDYLRITVSDHGKGFDGDGIMSDPKAAHGLLDIRSRLNLLGCNLQVLSKPGDGTQIIVDAPIQGAPSGEL